MRALENRLPIPRVDVEQVAAWFAEAKIFANNDLVVNTTSRGVPVEAGGAGDLDATLRYGNHSSMSQRQHYCLDCG